MSVWKVTIVTLFVLLLWLLWPIYGFYSHYGKLPMLPYGWVHMSDDAPEVQELSDVQYQEAAKIAMAAIKERRAAIDAPAMSAAVWVKDEVVWKAAVGWADIKTQRPASVDTQFRIGSTSKAITATALARLVDQGVIDLDAPISTYFDEIPNVNWGDLTARQLASHMAGVPHYEDVTDPIGLYRLASMKKHYRDVRDALDIFDESPLLFEPGTKFSYSSLGTVLLGATMSEAAEKPYRQIIKEEVLLPAAMHSTIVAPKRAGKSSDLATFYYIGEQGHREWRPVDLSHRLPGGGFASTPSDLVRMGAKYFDNEYITPETRAAFWTPQKLSSGEVNEQNYALGWRWREYEFDGIGLARNANHGGVSRGSQSWLIVFPDYEMAIAVNINSRTEEFFDFAKVYRDIFQAFATTYQVVENSSAIE